MLHFGNSGVTRLVASAATALAPFSQNSMLGVIWSAQAQLMQSKPPFD